MKKIFICIVAITYIITCPSNAEYSVDTNAVEDALDGSYKDLIGNISIENLDIEKGIDSLLNSGVSIFKKELKSSFASSFGIIVCCAMVSIASSFINVSGSTIGVKISNYTCSLAILLLTVVSGKSVLSSCRNAIISIDTFSKILTPTFAISVAIAKHPLTAVSTGSAALIFFDIFIIIVTNLVIPSIYMYTILGVIGTMTEVSSIDKICDLFKWIITMFYKIILIAFFGYISLAGLISSATDLTTLKTTKTVISNSVPIVGSIIADASDAILSGAGVIKISIGVFGFLGVCAICLIPFIKSLTGYIVFKVVSAISGSFCNNTICKVIDKVADSYNLALASLASCSALLFIMIVVTSVVTYS